MSRDAAELYKDKIEVSLDGRQIFYLFFGGAVIVGLVFVLGVMVGRRVEARGHTDRAHTEASTDPLAALDRLEGSGGAGVTFNKDLLAPPAAVPAVDPVETKIEAQKQAEAAPVAKKDDAKKDEPKVEKKDVEKKDEAKKDDAKKDDAKKDEAKAEKKAKHDDKDAKDADDAKETKARYTLQLSSFQDKGEAQSFLDDIKAAGFDASITEATVDGKAYFRVRLGNYRSLEAANDAKAQLEKSAKKSAQVMRL
nr:SPOR domain-containing protein [Kofleriaceae bacterium]